MSVFDGNTGINYRAVRNRCAVDLEAMHLPISTEGALLILERHGFSTTFVNLTEIARGCIGQSSYRRGARMLEAPKIFDCSLFTKWCYGWRGIWLPRRSIQQRGYGMPIAQDKISSDDLIFASGKRYADDPRNGVTHVGLATNDGTVIHAVRRRSGVVEESLDAFMKKREFMGARCVMPHGRIVRTLIIPDSKDIETSDDIRWVILDSLSWK